METITVPELKAKLKSGGKPVLVKFQTSWCGICKVNAPIVADVEKKYGQRIDFVQIDADDAKAWGEDGDKEFNIKLVPTYLFYVDGKQVWKKNNFVGAPVFEEVFKRELSGK